MTQYLIDIITFPNNNSTLIELLFGKNGLQVQYAIATGNRKLATGQ